MAVFVMGFLSYITKKERQGFARDHPASAWAHCFDSIDDMRDALDRGESPHTPEGRKRLQHWIDTGRVDYTTDA